MPLLFSDFCKILMQISEAHSEAKKMELLSTYYSSIEYDDDLKITAQFMADGALPAPSAENITIGSRTISTAFCNYLDLDYEKVFKPCRQACTSLSETITLLFLNFGAEVEQENLSLTDIAEVFKNFAKARTANEKKKLLKTMLIRMTAIEVEVFLQLLQGNEILRNAYHLNSDALANAFGSNREKVLRCRYITGCFGKTALLSKYHKPDTACTTLFQQYKMMPFESHFGEIHKIETYLFEKQPPGIRCHIHIKGGKTAVYSFDDPMRQQPLNETASYLSKVISCDCILEGYLNAAGNQSNGFFTVTDILHYKNRHLLEEPLIRRKQLLKELFGSVLSVGEFFSFRNKSELRLFIGKGNKQEILFKHKNSKYFPDLESPWKNFIYAPFQLNTAIIYAHTSPQNRNKVEAFTLGISVKKDEDFEQRIIPIGKIDNDFTDDSFFNSHLDPLVYERFGPTLAVKPELKLQIYFKEAVQNNRTKAGFSLNEMQFNGFLQHSDEISSLDEVREFYNPVKT